jgi:hypothetical protein
VTVPQQLTKFAHQFLELKSLKNKSVKLANVFEKTNAEPSLQLEDVSEESSVILHADAENAALLTNDQTSLFKEILRPLFMLVHNQQTTGELSPLITVTNAVIAKLDNVYLMVAVVNN